MALAYSWSEGVKETIPEGGRTGNPCFLVGKHLKVLPTVSWKVRGTPNFREEIENKLLLLLFTWLLFGKILQERDMLGEDCSVGKDE